MFSSLSPDLSKLLFLFLEINKMKLIYGAGINDKSRAGWIDGKDAKEYALWRDMLRRCYNQKIQAKQPTYIGCRASDNFLNYSYFYDWCNHQTGFGKIGTNGRYWQLDKDILMPNNKIYSEDVCVFVPSEINTFFIDRGNDRGNWPIGVSFHKQRGKFISTCRLNGKNQHLGLFSTHEQAHTCYKEFKENLCKELAAKWRGQIDERVYDAMMAWKV